MGLADDKNTILVIDRSTDTQSVALVKDGQIFPRVFAGEDARSGDWPLKVRDFLASRGVVPGGLDQIVVGQGPGSFAGIRAALAFAQGLALGSRAEVFGLPSTLALTRDNTKVAVVGDARRDRYWVTLYDGVHTVKDFFLVRKEELGGAVPDGFAVVTATTTARATRGRSRRWPPTSRKWPSAIPTFSVRNLCPSICRRP